MSLPQNAAWQITLRTWIGTLVSTDFDCGIPGLTYDSAWFTGDDDLLYKTWLTFGNLGRDISPTIRGVRQPSSVYLLSTIENGGDVYMNVDNDVEPMQMAWLWSWDYPGNPYHNQIETANRALVGAICDMIMTSENYGNSQTSASAFSAQAYVFHTLGHLLPSAEQQAYKDGLEVLFELLDASGPTGIQADLELQGVVAMYYAGQALGGEFITRARTFAEDFMSSHYKAAGFIDHGNGFDPSYNGFSIHYMLWAAHATDYEFIAEYLHQMSKLKAHLSFKEQEDGDSYIDGVWIGPSHFSTNTASGSPEDQSSSTVRDNAVSYYSTHARYLRHTGRTRATWLEPLLLVDVATMLTDISGWTDRANDDSTALGSYNVWVYSYDTPPGIWSSTAHQFPPNMAWEAYPGTGHYARALTETEIQPPFESDEDFIEEFDNEFVIWKLNGSGGVIHLGRLAWWTPNGEAISGHSGGSLSAYWTKDTNLTSFGFQSGYAGSTPDTMANLNTWASQHIWGRNGGDPFTSGRNRIVERTVIDINPEGTSTVLLTGSIGSHDDARSAPNDAILGTVGYTREFKIKQDGLFITSTLTSDEADTIDELWEAFPIYLSDHVVAIDPYRDSVIETCHNDIWSPLVRGQEIPVDKISIYKDGKYVVITFVGTQSIYFEPVVSDTDYQIDSRCQMAHIRLAGAGNMPASVSVSYELSQAQDTRDEQLPHHSWPRTAVAWWSGDSLSDSINSEILVPVGSPTLSTGLKTDAFYTTSAGDYYKVVNANADKYAPRLSDMTIAFWYYNAAGNTDGDGFISFGGNPAAGQPGYSISPQSDNLEVVFQDALIQHKFNTNAASLVDDTWQSCVAVFNRAGNLEIYIDKVLVGTEDISDLELSDIIPTQDFILGANYDLDASDSRLNQIIIDRRAWDMSEILRYHQGGNSLTYAEVTSDVPAHLFAETFSTDGSNSGSEDILVKGVKAGDDIILVVGVDGTHTMDAPIYESDGSDAGFTLLDTDTQGNTLTAWYKHATPLDEGDVTYTLGLDSGLEKFSISYIVTRGEGLDGTAVITTNSLTTNPTSPSITTTGANSRVYHVLCVSGAGTEVSTPPASTDFVYDVGDQGSGGVRMYCYSDVQEVAGATGVRDWVITSGQNSVGLTFAVKQTELVSDYGAGSGARKVYIEYFPEHIGGSGAQKGYPLMFTERAFLKRNPEAITTGHADVLHEGSIRYSLDPLGRDPIPGFLSSITLDTDPNESVLEGYIKSHQINTTNSIGNGVFVWWIPGSGKTQPAINGRRGENDTINKEIVFAGLRSNFTDSSVRNNDATNSGVGENASVLAYGSEPSWDFNGTTDYLEIPDDDTLTNTAGITLMFWMYADSGQVGLQGLVGKRTADDNIEYSLSFDLDGDLSLEYYDGAAVQGLDLDWATHFSTSAWMHITAEIWEDGADVKLRVLRDNVEVGSSTIASSSIETNTASIKVGAIESPAATFSSNYDGKMKGLTIFNTILPDDIKTSMYEFQTLELVNWRADTYYTGGEDETGQGFKSLSAPLITETLDANVYTSNPNITHFEEYTVDTQASDWTEQWNTGDGSTTVVVDSKAIGSKLLRIAAGTTNHYAVSWKEQVHADVEVLARVRTSSKTGDQSRVIVRGSGSAGTENAYMAELRGGTTLSLTKLVAGTATDIDTDAFVWEADQFYWIRLQAIGDSIKAKIWSINNLEPTTWNAEGTDTDVTAGWIGIGRDESAIQDCDVFTYGLKGEPAVLSYAEEVVLDKPAGYWSLNQTVAGSIADFTRANNMTREGGTFGNDALVWNDPKGHSFEMDGIDDYLWAENAFSGTGIGRTIELIFENQGGQQPLIELATSDTADQAFRVYAYIPTGLDGSSTFDTTNGLVIDFEDRQIAVPYDAISEGRHHIMIGWDGATAFTVMINGTTPDYYKYESSSWSTVQTQPVSLAATVAPAWKQVWVGRSTTPLWSDTSTFGKFRVAALALYNSYLSEDRMYAKYIAAGAGDSNYYTDMREYESETKPADWSNRWGAGDETLVARNVDGATYAKALSIRSLTADKYAWSWDKLNSVYSFDTMFKIRQDTYSGSQGSFWFRAGGESGSENGYYIEWDGTTGLSLWRSDAGTATEISNQTSITRSDNEWYWVRVRLVGDTVTVKTWEEFGPEPNTWLIDESNLTEYNTGWVGFSTEAIVQLDVDQIAITVGTHKQVTKNLLAWTNFSEYNTGSAPSDWEARWEQTGLWDVEADGTATGGQVLVHEPTSEQMISIVWKHKEDRDVEVLTKVKVTSVTTDTYNPGVTVRNSGDAASPTHYGADLLRFSSADTLRLFEHISGTFTQHTGPSITLAVDTYYWLRFRVEEDGLYAKYWEDGSSEPGSWTTSTTDTSLTEIGSVGLHHFLDDAKYHYDVFAMASGGQTALVGSPPVLGQSAGFGEDAFGDTAFGSIGFSAVATGLSVEFNAAGIAAGDYDIARYEWDLGDGNNLIGVSPGSHVYTDPGDYFITLYVTDVMGQQSVYSKWVKLAGTARTNFAEYETGTNLPYWTERYVNETYTIVDSVGELGAKTLQVTPASGALKELSYKDLQAEDLEVMTKFIHSANARAGINLRSKSGAPGNETFYLCEYESNTTSSLRIIKVVDGVETTLDTNTSVSITNGNKYCMVFQAIGDALKAKIWLSTDPEPGTWTTEITDSSITGPGTLGVNIRDAAVQVDLDYFSAGFNGTDSPDPGVSVRIDTDLTAAEGATIQIPILIDDTTGLNIVEWQATVTYDSTLIDITGVTNAGTLSSALTVTPDVSNADRIIISAATGTALTGDGTLILLDATLLDVGEAALSLIDVELNDNVTAPDALTSDGILIITGDAHPTAVFTSTPDNGTASLVVNFDANDSTFGGGTAITSYSWDFGDGSSAGSGVSPAHTYTAAGIFTVTLTVTNDNSDVAIATDEITVRNVPVSVINGAATITGGPAVGMLTDVGAWLELEDATDSHTTGADFTDPGVTFGAAKLGNGMTGASDSLTYAYTDTSAFSVGTDDWSLNFWTKWTAVEQGSTNIISTNDTDFRIKHLFSGTERIQFEINNSLSGFTRAQITSLTTGTWYNVHAEYNSTTQDLRIRLNDDDALEHIVNVGGTGLGRASTVHIGGHGTTKYHGDIDNIVVRRGSLWTDAQITLLYGAGDGLTYAAALAGNAADTLDWEFNAIGSEGGDSNIAAYEWDFNDGSPLEYGPAVTHTYAAGTYNPTLTVYNLNGDSTTSTMEVVASQVSTTDPTASFTSTPDNGPNPTTVAFDATASDGGSGTITDYSWDFGDGSAAGTGSTPSHEYTTAGTYTVTLTVTNDESNTDQATDSIIVRVPPVASFTSTPDNGASPFTVVFDASATTDGDGSSITSYSWDFGDGSAAGSGVNPSHEYSSTGTHTVTLTVTNDLGDTDTATDDITVRSALTALINGTSGGAGVGILDDVSLWLELEDATDSHTTGVVFTDNGVTYGAAKLGNGVIGPGVDGNSQTLQTSAALGGPITVGANDWSINLWVKWTSVGHVSRSIISLSNTDFQIQQLFSGTERLSFFYNTEVGNGATQVTGLTVGTWYNMHAQYTAATKEIKVRLNDDDALTSTSTLTDHPRDRAANLFIGGHNSSSTYHGDIDNVIIRKGSLWSDAQISLLHGSGSGLSYSAAAALNVPTDTLDWDFSAAGSDGGDSAIVSYEWDFDDGSAVATGETVSHTYAAGTYNPTLTITNADGDTKTSTMEVVAAAAAGTPTASFTSTPDNGAFPVTVAFDASASTAGGSATITDYSWDFGDGSAAGTGVSPSHEYTTAGSYTVTLTVTNSDTNTDQETDTITVRTGPVASFTSTPDNGGAPLDVTFDASATTDGDGGSISSYSWDFGDGSAAGSGVNPTHTYAAAGSYTVTLTATNDLGDVDTETDSITVRVGPTASFTSTPDNGPRPLSVSFDASATTDGDGSSITTYSWNWGDGSPVETGVTASHSYTGEATYTVTLTVTNDLGDTDQATDDIEVRTAPTAAFTSTPDNGQIPVTVAFDAGTTTTGSGASISSYSWSWGDGTPDGTGETPSHTYTTADSFTVTLTVTNDEGDTDTETDTIVSRSGPTASFTSTPDNGAAPLDVTFDAAASTEGDGASISSYSWDFGDGSAAGSGVNPTHQYTSDGTYTVTLTVTNNNSDTAQTTDSIIVGVAGPNATFLLTPVSGAAPLTVDVDASSSDAGGGTSITTYSWDWDDGTPDTTGEIQGHDYTTPGTYNIVLTITNDNSDTDTDTQSIVVRTPPTASFTSTPDAGTAPLTVAVDATASSDGDGSSITNYAWDWGDGTFGTGVTNSHEYATPGTYNITLTVTNNLGDEGELDDVITVNGTDIVATIAGDETATVNETISIPISVTDTTGKNITAYSFDVVFDPTILSIDSIENTGSLSSGATPVSNESPAGTLSVSWAHTAAMTGVGDLIYLTVTALSAGVSTLVINNLVWNEGDPTADVNNGQFTAVAPTGPTASFTANPTSGFTPLSVEFNAGGSVAGDNAITEYSWDFGDGSATVTGVNPTHEYTTADTFTVTLTVTDSASAEDTATTDITTSTPPADPVAAFTSTPDTGDAPLDVDFDASSTDVGGGTSITSYSWDFGDGSAAGTGETPSHTYAAAGTYTVTLTVTNDNDDTDQATDTITATSPNQAPNAAFTQDVISGEAPLVVSFDATGSSDPDGTIVGYSWSFGDGGTASGDSPTYTYNTPGTYTAVLTVTDNDGGVDQASVLITVAVTNQPPVAVSSSDVTSGAAPLVVTFDGSGSSDPDGTIATYEWDFGDGSTATGVNPVHTYNSGGQFTARLTVTDDGGKTSSVFLDILVASIGNDSQVDIRLLAGKKVRVYNKPPASSGASPDRLVGKSSLQNARRQTKSDLNTVRKILNSINKNNLFS